MIIDVSSVLKEAGARLSLEGGVRIPDMKFAGGNYRFKKPADISGTVVNNGTALALEADCECAVETQCARCMKDIDVNVDFHVSETLMRGEEADENDEDIIIFEGHEIDIDPIVADNFIMNVETRYLCREDCKGLCPKCGADLNEGECGCADDEIDPRWAALAKMIEKED